MAHQDDETTPLLQSQQIQAISETPAIVHQLECSMQGDEPPPYSSYDEKSTQPPSYYVRRTRSEGSSAAGSLNPHINCRVCKAVLSVEGKLDLQVIQCHSCGEATPIRPAPSGKKYVRCQCNCLLMCKATSQRIICLRPNCKIMITLGPTLSATSFDRPSGSTMQNPTRRIICAHCNASFLWVLADDNYDKCPHCDQFSSFGPGYRAEGIKVTGAFGALALLFLIVCTVIFVSCAEDDGHCSLLSVIAFVLSYAFAMILILRGLRFAYMKVSRVEQSNMQ